VCCTRSRRQANDRLGHAAGDEVLGVVVERLRAAVRPGDLVARLGGDEFAVLCSDPVDGDDLATIAARIVARVAEPMEVAGRRVQVAASVGGARSTAAPESPDELVERADAAQRAA
jgi:diguanylate cyclase (GGDEF)-like protein